MIKRILIGVTGTPSTPTKKRVALDLAKRHGATVEFLSVVDVERLSHVGPVPIGGEMFADRLRESRIRRSHELAEQSIEEAVSECEKAGVPTRVLSQEGDPFEVLAAEWRYNDLTLLGLRDWFDHEVVKEPEDTLIRLVESGVRPILALAEETRPIAKAMIAYDGSKEAARSMKSFAHYGLWPGIACHVACFGLPAEEARNLLDRACGYFTDHGYETTGASVEGKARDRLLEHADEIDADLIVMGSSHHRVMMHRVFSETTLHVIKHCHKALFVSH